MKITKFGHSCLFVEEKDARILLDPGSFTAAQNKVVNLDAVLITHEHFDHLDKESIAKIKALNPQARVLTNKGAGKLLDEMKIPYELLEHGGRTEVRGVSVEGVGELHAVIYTTIPQIPNTGYFIGGRLFYPGDALYEPGREVEILALPAIAPWSKTTETIDYALRIKPKVCFPVHDGILKTADFLHRLLEGVLPPLGVPFQPLKDGESVGF